MANIAWPDEQMSEHFTLYDLTKTSQNADNTPIDLPLSDGSVLKAASIKKNIKRLANDLLEPLYTQVGPFTVASAFRSYALQELLREQGKPVATKISFHETGEGADLIPDNMSLEDFHAKTAALFMGKGMIGEAYIKPEEGQMAIHITLPNARNIDKFGDMYNGVYREFTDEEKQSLVDKYWAAIQQLASDAGEAFDDVYEATMDAANAAAKHGPSPIMIVALVAGAALFLLNFMGAGKRARA